MSGPPGLAGVGLWPPESPWRVTALSLPMQKLWRLAFSASGCKVQPQQWGRSGLWALLWGGGGGWEGVLLGRVRRKRPCPPQGPEDLRVHPSPGCPEALHPGARGWG